MLYGFKTMIFFERHFPILCELFESNSVVFLIIGAIFGFLFGFKLTNSKSRIRAVISCVAVYAVCEGIGNIPMRVNFLLDFILLIVGTAALGAVLGILLNMPVYGFFAEKE